ncbi:MAG: DUF389 domain-containing protein [Saprospiraceae bacterium]|nr:DUF389 domain-containing protein [Saprospiraceae bacterium]
MENNPTEQGLPENKSLKSLFKEVFYAVKDWFADLIDLKEGLSREGTIIAIKNNKRMRGANAWMLMCSIMIASLGLDLDSAAVIIGAMLISPLMAPILGIGLAVGINDREALIISLRHFSIAIFIALITSTFYFSITPLGLPTSEILRRTSPNLLDSLVAVFGGLAGIISISRKDQSNAIPGVAIATALMPPLCVSGYGLANGNWQVMLNAFYLFFLNSFFIALTTYIIIRLLKFPFKAHLDERDARRTSIFILVFSLIIILPSAKILKDLIVFQKNKAKAELFIQDHFKENCIDFSFVEGDTTNQLVLELLGRSITPDSVNHYNNLLATDYDLKNTILSIIQDNSIRLDKINKMQLELSSLGQIANQLETVNTVKTDQETLIKELSHKIDSINSISIPLKKIGNELKTIFPKLDEVGFANIEKSAFNNGTVTLPLLIIKWDRKTSLNQRQNDEKKIYDFMIQRANLDTLQIIAY